MFCHKCKCCTFSWLSGFFATVALIHIVRLVVRPEIVLNGWTPSMGLSVVAAVVAGALSLFLCKKSCAACGCSPK